MKLKKRVMSLMTHYSFRFALNQWLILFKKVTVALQVTVTS